MNWPAGSSRSIPATAICSPNRFQSPRTRTRWRPPAVPPSPGTLRWRIAPRARGSCATVTGASPHSADERGRPRSRVRRSPSRAAGVRERGDQLLRVRQPPIRRRRPAGPLHRAARPNRVGGAATYSPSPSAPGPSATAPSPAAAPGRGTFAAAPGSTKNSIRRSGVSVTGPSVSSMRSIRARARNPARLRHVERVERPARRQQDRGRRLLLPHPPRDASRCPVACVAQSGAPGARPGAAQPASPQEQRCAPVGGLQPGAGEHVPVPLLGVAHGGLQQRFPALLAGSGRLRCLRWSLPRATQLPSSPGLRRARARGRSIDPASGAHGCTAGARGRNRRPERVATVGPGDRRYPGNPRHASHLAWSAGH